MKSLLKVAFGFLAGVLLTPLVVEHKHEVVDTTKTEVSVPENHKVIVIGYGEEMDGTVSGELDQLDGGAITITYDSEKSAKVALKNMLKSVRFGDK